MSCLYCDGREEKLFVERFEYLNGFGDECRTKRCLKCKGILFAEIKALKDGEYINK